MKTSTKLILIYSGLIVAGIVFLYVSPSVTSKKNVYEGKHYSLYEKKLSDFSVVVLQDSALCVLTLADSCSLQWTQPKGEKSPVVKIINDTLYAKRPEGENCYLDIKAKHLTAIFVKNGSNVSLLEPNQDKLYVQLENGQFFLNRRESDTKNNESRSKNLHLTLNASNKSYAALYTPIKALTAVLDSSEMKIDQCAYIQTISLTENHGSSSTMFQFPEQFTLRRSLTSTLKVY